jgi:hypothetical protein
LQKQFTIVTALATTPQTQPAEPGPIRPDEPRAVDVVVRAQVNIDPQLSDRIGFARTSSGGSRMLGSSLVEVNDALLQFNDQRCRRDAGPGVRRAMLCGRGAESDSSVCRSGGAR